MTQIKKEIRKILHSREIYDEVPVEIIATAVEKMVVEARIEELDWIEKSHHQDGCSWSRTLPMYTKCDCGKLEILNARRRK